MPTDAFYVHLDAVIEQARLQGAAACVPGAVKRPWNIPAAAPLDGTDIESASFAKRACDRNDLNSKAISAYESGKDPNSGRLGQVMAYKKAIDYQAAYERAFIARHASAVRRRVWAMARRTGHGSKTYGVFGAVRNELDAFIGEAQSVDNAPRGSLASDHLIGLS